MAEGQPMWMQALCYSYNELRSLANVCGEGVIDVFGGSLLVASSGAADHSVTIAAGSAWVEADGINVEGMYRVPNDGPVTVQLDAGGGGNPRVDTIVATVKDSQSTGVDNLWTLQEPLIGTPNASAALTPAGIAASAAAVPDMTLVLGYVLVPAADTLTTTISAANVLDARLPYEQCGAAVTPSTRWDRNATQSLNDGTSTTIDFDAVSGSAVPNAYYSAEASGSITFRIPGLYLVEAEIWYDGAGTTAANILRRYTSIQVNGADVQVESGSAIASATVDTVQHVAGVVPIAVGDVLRLRGYQDSGGSLNVVDAYMRVTFLGVAA